MTSITLFFCDISYVDIFNIFFFQIFTLVLYYKKDSDDTQKTSLLRYKILNNYNILLS